MAVIIHWNTVAAALAGGKPTLSAAYESIPQLPQQPKGIAAGLVDSAHRKQAQAAEDNWIRQRQFNP